MRPLFEFPSLWPVCAVSAAMILVSCNSSAPQNNTSGGPGVPIETVAVNGLQMMFCEEIAERVTQQECEDYGRLLAMTRRGLGAFNVPSPMYRGETVPLQLVVSFAPEHDPAIVERYENQTGPLDNGAMPDPGNEMYPGNTAVTTEGSNTAGPAETVESLPGNTVTFVPTVGRHMRAELSGAGFEIRALSPAEQPVPLDGQTSWNWEVKPTSSSAQTLTLRTMVLAPGPGGRYRVLKSSIKNQTVTVEVRWYDRLGDILDGVPVWIRRLTAILVALGALVGAWYALKKRRQKRAAGVAPPNDSEPE